MQRWRKPVTVAAVESDPEYIWVDADGTERDHYDLTFTEENWERIRQGYACLRCWEAQETGFPEQERHLPGCPGVQAFGPHYIRERQRRDIEREFYGHKWVGPKKRLDETLAEDDEKRRKYKQDTGREAGPWVPPWVKL